MIHEHIGDLLASDCTVLAHQCNCHCVMGAGLAKAIKTAYPEAYYADLLTIPGDRTKLGSFTCGLVGSQRPDQIPERIIYNLYGQFGFGSGLQTDYDELALSLFAMRNHLSGLQCLFPSFPVKIGMPRLGCGLAGGDWLKVKPLIEQAFPGTDVHVWSLK